MSHRQEFQDVIGEFISTDGEGGVATFDADWTLTSVANAGDSGVLSQVAQSRLSHMRVEWWRLMARQLIDINTLHQLESKHRQYE